MKKIVNDYKLLFDSTKYYNKLTYFMKSYKINKVNIIF